MYFTSSRKCTRNLHTVSVLTKTYAIGNSSALVHLSADLYIVILLSKYILVHLINHPSCFLRYYLKPILQLHNMHSQAGCHGCLLIDWIITLFAVVRYSVLNGLNHEVSIVRPSVRKHFTFSSFSTEPLQSQFQPNLA